MHATAAGTLSSRIGSHWAIVRFWLCPSWICAGAAIARRWRQRYGTASHCRSGQLTHPIMRAARRHYLRLRTPVAGAALLYATRTGPCDAMRNCTQRIPGGTSLAVLHDHLQMCLQPWTHAACSSGALSGAGLQPAGQKLAPSGSMRLPDWRRSSLHKPPAATGDAGYASAASSCSAVQRNPNEVQRLIQRIHEWQRVDCLPRELLANAGGLASRWGKQGSRDRSCPHVSPELTQREFPDCFLDV